ncbi:MAG TPA: hypothetical protein VN903_32390 [Polyangia bacterium]|nr:hypothetical protein [Polyangia bacterium]
MKADAASRDTFWWSDGVITHTLFLLYIGGSRILSPSYSDSDLVVGHRADLSYIGAAKSVKRPPMGNNFFENPAHAKRAMRDNLFTEVYLSTSVTTPIQLKGWVSQANPFERHGQRWHLYLSRVEMLRRLAARQRKNSVASGIATPAPAPEKPVA